jgi:hypothetical protein
MKDRLKGRAIAGLTEAAEVQKHGGLMSQQKIAMMSFVSYGQKSINGQISNCP